MRFLRFVLALAAAVSVVVSALGGEPDPLPDPGLVWVVPIRICVGVFPPLCTRSRPQLSETKGV